MEKSLSKLRNHKKIAFVSAWSFIVLAGLYSVFTLSGPVEVMGTYTTFEYMLSSDALVNNEIDKMVWVISILIPYLLVSGGMGYYSTFRSHAPYVAGFMLLSFIASAIGYSVALARWALVNMNFATVWPHATEAEKQGMARVSSFLDGYIGNVFGIYLAEGALALALALLCVGMVKSKRFPKWLISLVSLASVWLGVCLLRVPFPDVIGLYAWGEILQILPLTFIAIGFGIYFFRQPREKKLAKYNKRSKKRK